jgi:SNF2 family DNA or RNA helicase
MIEINWNRCATKPRDHQKVGVRWFLKDADPANGRVIPRVYLLADEVGAGKSKQVVDAEQLLYETSDNDSVVVIPPAFARGVWANPDPNMGEIAKHTWPSIPHMVAEYSVRTSKLPPPVAFAGKLLWVVSNYEFIRQEHRLLPLLNFLAKRRFLLVCDEAWALKDYGTDQWRAVHKIRKLANRVILLNGTPIADSPLDLFAQMKMLDERILGIKWFSHFRARYAMMKPNSNFPVITGWQNLEELRDKVAPYILRRRTRECFDLPPILEPVTIEAKLKDETWKVYKQMRDEMVAWVGTEGEASVAKQAIVKGLRLAQITSGFLGGIQKIDLEDGVLDFGTELEPIERLVEMPASCIKEIGSEKLDTLVSWLAEIDSPERLLIWARFRAEIERAARVLGKERVTFKLYGGQTREERDQAVRALNPTMPWTGDRPVAVIGSPQAGGAALNLAGASMAINLSHDFNLRVYLQARGRIDRPGQTQAIRYVDIVATGPKGQKTIDHHVIAALRAKEDIATWTAATWKRKLMEE